MFVYHFRDYDSFWLRLGRGRYCDLITAQAGIAVIVAVWRHAKTQKALEGFESEVMASTVTV